MKKLRFTVVLVLLAAGVTFGKVPNADANFYTTSDISSGAIALQLHAENETNRCRVSQNQDQTFHTLRDSNFSAPHKSHKAHK